MSDKMAFLFPGQGSQSVGMLAVYMNEPVVKATFAEASGVLGFDLMQLVNEGPAEELNKTENTQPALLTASVALYRLYQERGGVTPAMMAGHSLGEYSALVCAGVINFKDAVALVRARGQFMQQAVAPGVGAMAAILGLADADIVDACAASAQGQVVEAVNFNSPGQVVIAGDKDAVARAIDACKAAGAKRAVELPVSVPSHCALMKPAAEKLQEMLAGITFNEPQVPVLQNVNAAVDVDPERIKANLVTQLFRPVLWVETIANMLSGDIQQFAECGPGKVLSGLNKRISKTMPIAALESADELAALLSLVKGE